MVIFLNPLKGKSKAHFTYLASEKKGIDTLHIFPFYSRLFSTFILNVINFAVTARKFTSPISLIPYACKWTISVSPCEFGHFSIPLPVCEKRHLITQMVDTGLSLGAFLIQCAAGTEWILDSMPLQLNITQVLCAC